MTFFGCNIYLLVSRGKVFSLQLRDLFTSNDIEDFASNMSQALSLISFYFFNRKLSNRDANPSSVSGQGLTIVALLYLALSTTTQSAFPIHEFKPQDSFGLYWAADIPVLKYSIYAYLPVAVTNCLVSTFISTQMLESLAWFKKLSGLNQEIPETKALVLSRMAVWTLSVATTGLFSSVLTVISAAGSLFTPLVGFIVPLVYFYTYHISRGTNHLSAKRILLDAMLVVVTIYFMYLGFRNVLSGKFED